jgi:N-acetylmannosamine-6-phosphate 2-epimerase / N-acetylmannosamine kinase
MARLAAPWAGRYDRVGVTVTGLVQGGLWSALNPATLNIPPGFPLADRIEALFGIRPQLANDAQAAAWGEYQHGAGAGRDMLFLTISTGIGGGIVTGGRLFSGRQGLAGHFGQMLTLDPLPGPDASLIGGRIEDRAAGLWMAEAARAAGHETDARGVFAAADRSEPWAEVIVSASALRVARLCQSLHLPSTPRSSSSAAGSALRRDISPG